MTHTLTFQVRDAEQRCIDLAPAASPPTFEMWQAFAGKIIDESGLRPTPPEALIDRWARGQGAVLLHEGQIIGHTSLVEIFCAANRKKFTDALGIAVEQLPAVDVWKLATSWTDPDWRRRHIQMQLTRALEDRCAGKYLLTAVAIGLAGSPLIVEFGWKIVSWAGLPFMTGLIGIPASGYEDRIEARWWPPPGVVRYNGPHLSPYEDTGHDWARYGHLWVSSPEVARELDDAFCALLDGDLDRWRHASITVFGGHPKSLLNFFQE